MAIGDLDGDFDIDLVVGNQLSNNVSVLLNDGDGTFADDVKYGVGQGPLSIVVGDLDADLDLDVVVANSGNDNISVLWNNGDGTFALTDSYAVGLRRSSWQRRISTMTLTSIWL